MEGGRYTIKQLPTVLRPRERLLSEGPEALSSAELLGILFGAGTKESTAVELAGQVISESGDLFGLYGVSVHDLLGLHGIGEARACTILAAVEFGKRLGRVRNPGRPVISSPADVDGLLRGRIANLDRENFVAVLLNTKNEVMEFPTISASAASVVLAHNHPSGKVEPSREDREVTGRLVGAAEIIGIEVLDHVILGDGYFSMKEHGML